MKISPTQLEILRTIRAHGGRLIRRHGGFWTYPECPTHTRWYGGSQFEEPVWSPRTPSINALVAKKLLVREDPTSTDRYSPLVLSEAAQSLCA